MAKAAKCGGGKPPEKPKSKSKLTDEERHKRFVEMAHEVEADESQLSFDQAFSRVVASTPTIKSKGG